jgi:6,7-dimethyl-8-ribityllumazine synthase
MVERERSSVPQRFEGRPTAPKGRLAIVVARYNETITQRLLDGALATLKEHGVADEQIDVAWVPGAFEIPLVAARMAESRRYVAVLCLGAVIRGETTHDEHINRAVSQELAAMSVRWQVPVLFGVLTCNSMEQAIHRAGGNVGNKGSECAEAALRMADLLAQMPG